MIAPFILKLCSILQSAYYSQNNASIRPLLSPAIVQDLVAIYNYSKLNGHTAEELPTYNVSIHSHPQTQPQTLPPHAAALYDTANYPNEPTPPNTIMLKQ